MVRAGISKLLRKITIVFVICFCSLSAQGKYGGGSGTSDDPYLIYDANQMNIIGLNKEDWDKCFKLMADIDLVGFTGTEFNIIGNYSDSFTGVFDGNGKKIFNFTYASTGQYRIGLFGCVNDPNALIKDLRLTDPNVNAGPRNYVGSLVGYLRDGTISGSYAEGASVAGNDYVGGLVGCNSGGTITNCYSNGSVSGDKYVGGLVGENHRTITNCNSEACVSGNNYVGGLVGKSSYGIITNCYTKGIVSGKLFVGGLMGENFRGKITNCGSINSVFSVYYWVGGLVGLNSGTITNCCTQGGSVAGESSVGGLVGGNTDTITDCYSIGSVSGNIGVGGLAGGNGGTITNCCSIASVLGGYEVGGLVGLNGGLITDCYATGSVLGDDQIGGLVGNNSNRGTITNCYSTDVVSGRDNIGGLVGYNDYGTIINCYSTGSLTGTTNVGGLVGGSDQIGEVIASFWDIETSGQLSSAGGMAKTTDEMQMASTFVGWGCEPVWTIDDGNDYPRLWWENKPGEPMNSYGGGIGDPNDPYLIYTAEQLNTIGLVTCDWDKHFKLMDDIDLSEYSGTAFNIIGSYRSSTDNKPFTGVFDGNGHTISNFTYTSTGVNYIGLFGYVDDPNAEIKNLALINLNVHGGTGIGIGSLAGWLGSGTITGCYAKGSSVAGYEGIGGLVGNNQGIIIYCYSEGLVAGNSHIGGFVGKNDGMITNCYSTDSVFGDCYVGGLVGKNGDMITNCYSAGFVVGNSYPGGLVGYNQGIIGNSFWDVETSKQTTSDGGMGKTTAEMQMANTFVHWGACGQVWKINEGLDYPRIFWENKSGQPIVGFIPLEGNGVPNNPYLIYTADELNVIGSLPCVWDKHFKLMVDIDLSQFTGTKFNILANFKGTFDGNGHTISNFTYTSSCTDRIGLFGYVGGVIKDLGLINPEVDVGTGSTVGSLVGYLSDGSITNCYVEGDSIEGGDYVGGLVGYNRYGTITNCYLMSSVSGERYVGGLVGESRGTITNCYVEGDSIDGDDYVGGLVGYNLIDGTITNCYSTGIISGDERVGGLVGSNYNEGTITNCYSNGSVSGDKYVGGLVGRNFKGIISDCYSTNSVTGDNYVGGLVGWNIDGVRASFWDIETSGHTTSDGGTGLPTAEMQMASTFSDAGWDFIGETVNGIEDIWFIPYGDYPHLWWEGIQVPMKLTPGKLNCRSKGNWVKAHITLPQGFTVADVNSDRPAVLHSFGFQSAPLYVFVNKNELVEIEAAFERQAVCSLAGNWPQELTVAGFLADGNIFLGTSTVRIIHPGMNVIEDLAWYWLNADCDQPDFCDQIDMNRNSLVNLLDYALLMNINVEFVTNE